MVLDLGAGDGRAVLRRARRELGALVIAIEPVAAAMRESSARAASKPARGGLTNALFLAGTAEELPWRLRGRVDELIVALPWGSLLRGVLEPAMGVPHQQSGLVERLAATLRPGGWLTLLLSVDDADGATGLPRLDEAALDRLIAGYAELGLGCRELRRASAGDVALLSGSWGRRLGIPERRRAYLLTLTLADASGGARNRPAATGVRRV